jgi:lysophospholipase L1-like esterase
LGGEAESHLTGPESRPVQIADLIVRRAFCAAFLAALGAVACQALPPQEPAAAQSNWVSSWASAQQVPEPRNALPPGDLENATLRQVIRPSLGGSRARLRLSNVYGTTPLTLDNIRIARAAKPDSSEIDPHSSRAVTFSRQERVTIPAGAYMVSDPIDMRVEARNHLAVSIWFPAPPGQQTSHPGSRATSYIQPGNHVETEVLAEAEQVDHWYQLAGLDVESGDTSRALLVIGDSITDGFGVQPNTDRRWTDFLVARIEEDPKLDGTLAVLNVGLGGNRLLLDGLGPNGLARFDRDVLDRPGARHVIVALGVNDLGTLSRNESAAQRDHEILVQQMITAYEQMVARARQNDIGITGATITPFRGSTFYPSDELTEASRRAINTWIRTPGNFDAVIDFDALLRSPSDPAKMDARFDSGDHLHPSIAGYEAMAEYIPLDLFR